jgi:hypothetical protein
MISRADQTDLSPSSFTEAGDTVARALERGAVPGHAPTAPAGPSPADAAAAALSAAVAARIDAAAARLAPRGPRIRDASTAAAESLAAQDQRNTEAIDRANESY